MLTKATATPVYMQPNPGPYYEKGPSLPVPLIIHSLHSLYNTPAY